MRGTEYDMVYETVILFKSAPPRPIIDRTAIVDGHGGQRVPDQPTSNSITRSAEMGTAVVHIVILKFCMPVSYEFGMFGRTLRGHTGRQPSFVSFCLVDAKMLRAYHVTNWTSAATSRTAAHGFTSNSQQHGTAAQDNKL